MLIYLSDLNSILDLKSMTFPMIDFNRLFGYENKLHYTHRVLRSKCVRGVFVDDVRWKRQKEMKAK